LSEAGIGIFLFAMPTIKGRTGKNKKYPIAFIYILKDAE